MPGSSERFALVRFGKDNSFDKVVAIVALFADSHRPLHKEDLRQMDIVFRRLLRQVVGAQGELDWSMPWHRAFIYVERACFEVCRSVWVEVVVTKGAKAVLGFRWVLGPVTSRQMGFASSILGANG